MHNTPPDLYSLRCYVSLAHHLNFRQAAHAMALSPAAFSDRIKRLEEDVGGALFERTTRSVSLTELGVGLLPATRRLLDEAKRFGQAVEKQGRQMPYTIRLGTRHELGLSWIVPALATLGQDTPARRIDLVVGSDEDLLQRLRRQHIDAVISSVRINAGGLHTAPLHREDYVFVAAPSLLADVGAVSAKTAPQLTLIDIGPSLPLFRYYLDAAPDKAFWSFGAHSLLGTIAAVRHRVREGAGVGVLPRYFVEEDMESERLVPVHDSIELAHDYFRLIWLADHPLVSKLELLANQLRAIPLT